MGSIEGKIGTIVGRPGDLDTFAHKFLADRGYSDFEAASINHEITAAVDQALSTEAGPVVQAGADRIAKAAADERMSNALLGAEAPIERAASNADAGSDKQGIRCTSIASPPENITESNLPPKERRRNKTEKRSDIARCIREMGWWREENSSVVPPSGSWKDLCRMIEEHPGWGRGSCNIRTLDRSITDMENGKL
jgi:hypothetical protein